MSRCVQEELDTLTIRSMHHSHLCRTISFHTSHVAVRLTILHRVSEASHEITKDKDRKWQSDTGGLDRVGDDEGGGTCYYCLCSDMGSKYICKYLCTMDPR
jgi:hypothetical protein